MKRTILIIYFFLLAINSHSQINAVVIDSISKEIIPYVNIWIENENIGTTSNEKGEFTLDYPENSAHIVFSAIGYETRKIPAGKLGNIVHLNPQVTELREVVISAQLNKELEIGSFKKLEINRYWSHSTNPRIHAAYFKFKEEYRETAFLKNIRILTKSDVRNAKFMIRLYAVNDSGAPEGYIYNHPIAGIAEKGKRITEIDVSELNIEFPEQGVFIAIEWLITESNKHEYTVPKEGSREKYKKISYEPSIGVIFTAKDENNWAYIKGKWHKWEKGSYPRSKKEMTFHRLAIELILSN